MKYSVLSFVLVSLVSLVHADTFNNSNSHSIINTKEAWNQNITGKGVAIGIVDSPIKTDHPYLKDKVDDTVNYIDFLTGRTHEPIFTDCDRVRCDTH
ncbi:MAG: hypothetical protein PUJ79_03500, partial [Helicobacter sp.]|nr:hypothetical protein [Helicobacter sp.]